MAATAYGGQINSLVLCVYEKVLKKLARLPLFALSDEVKIVIVIIYDNQTNTGDVTWKMCWNELGAWALYRW